MQFNLFDWQMTDGHLADELLPIHREAWKVDVRRDGDDLRGYFALTVHVEAPSGTKREVWIEVEDGVLKVHCYDSAHDEPTTIFIDRENTLVRLDQERAEDQLLSKTETDNPKNLDP